MIRDQEVAAAIKDAISKEYDVNTWHCFVGRDLGCFVTHKEDCYIYLYIGQLGICLFATA